MGGDEFAVLCEVAHARAAEVLVRRVAADLDELLREADDDMYARKRVRDR